MKLFKFQPININTLSNLALKKNWASSVLDFNDPFEIPLDSKIILKDDGILSFDKKRVEYINALYKQLSKIGVVCYNSEADDSGSRVENNILMWSHYALGHRGMCLVFEVDSVPYGNLDRVDYQVKVPKINLKGKRSDHKKQARKAIYTKSKVWSYEHEVRSIHKESHQLVEYPGNLVEIIFGCAATYNDISLVWKIAFGLYSNDIQFSKMSIIDGSFLLMKEMPNKENHKFDGVPKSWAHFRQMDDEDFRNFINNF